MRLCPHGTHQYLHNTEYHQLLSYEPLCINWPTQVPLMSIYPAGQPTEVNINGLAITELALGLSYQLWMSRMLYWSQRVTLGCKTRSPQPHLHLFIHTQIASYMNLTKNVTKLTTVQQDVVCSSCREVEADSEAQRPAIAAWGWIRGTRWRHIKVVYILSTRVVEPDIPASTGTTDLQLQYISLLVLYGC